MQIILKKEDLENLIKQAYPDSSNIKFNNKNPSVVLSFDEPVSFGGKIDKLKKSIPIKKEIEEQPKQEPLVMGKEGERNMMMF